MIETPVEASLETLVIDDIAAFEEFSLFWVKDIPVVKHEIISLLDALAGKSINVNQLLQVTSRQGTIHILFTVPSQFREVVREEVQSFSEQHGAAWGMHEQVTRLVLTGSGIRTHSQVANRIVQLMQANDLDILMISSAEITLSIFVKQRQAERARSLLCEHLLHRTFS